MGHVLTVSSPTLATTMFPLLSVLIPLLCLAFGRGPLLLLPPVPVGCLSDVSWARHRSEYRKNNILNHFIDFSPRTAMSDSILAFWVVIPLIPGRPGSVAGVSAFSWCGPLVGPVIHGPLLKVLHHHCSSTSCGQGRQ